MFRPGTFGSYLVKSRRWVSVSTSLFAVVFLLSGLQLASAAPASWSEPDQERMNQGEVLLETTQNDKPGGAARIAAFFHSTTDEIWNVLGYCKYEFIYLRGLEVCEVLEPGLENTVVHHRLRSHWYTPTLDYTFKASRPTCCRGEFSLVEGDLDVMEGEWLLEPVSDPAGVIVTHEIRIKPGLPAPRWLVRRTLTKDLPDMLACMRGLAGASGDQRSLEGDLERCRGDISKLAK